MYNFLYILTYTVYPLFVIFVRARFIKFNISTTLYNRRSTLVQKLYVNTCVKYFILFYAFFC